MTLGKDGDVPYCELFPYSNQSASGSLKNIRYSIKCTSHSHEYWFALVQEADKYEQDYQEKS
jgi:hypothetical protein